MKTRQVFSMALVAMLVACTGSNDVPEAGESSLDQSPAAADNPTTAGDPLIEPATDTDEAVANISLEGSWVPPDQTCTPEGGVSEHVLNFYVDTFTGNKEERIQGSGWTCTLSDKGVISSFNAEFSGDASCFYEGAEVNRRITSSIDSGGMLTITFGRGLDPDGYEYEESVSKYKKCDSALTTPY